MYCYEDFSFEIKELIKRREGICGLADSECFGPREDFKLSSFDLKLIQESLTKVEYLNFRCVFDFNSLSYFLDMDVLYSEAYSAPVLYFNIYNLMDNKIVPVEEYILKAQSSSTSTKSTKSPLNGQSQDSLYSQDCLYSLGFKHEISKCNHPMNGRVYNTMHLCNFTKKMNQLKEIEFLSLWLSQILNILSIPIPVILYKSIRI